MLAWTYLLIAGLFEIGFTTSLKLSEGFTRLVPSLCFLAFAFVSFYLLTKAMQTIPLGTSYAIWTGIGAFGTALVGIIWFSEPANFLRLLFLFILIASIVGLKLVSK